MFLDRKDAGEKLAENLNKFENASNTVVMAIPYGGIIIGSIVADRLNIPFEMLIVRKLPLPYNSESGFGAVSEDGSVYIIDEAAYMLPENDIRRIQAEQIEEVKKRKKMLRNNRELPELRGKTVILIDDGLAMGSTMRVAVCCCRFKRADRIVVAVPVAGEEVAGEFERLVDEVVVLEKPKNFRAVAQVYQNWHDVSEEEARATLRHYYFLNKSP
ncbi:MAG: phosphoribosyltransferase family protein [Candidatus Omnitrophota bacterium]